MAVISCDLKAIRRGGSKSQRKGLLAEIINRSYQKVFKVVTNDPLDGPEIILTWPQSVQIPIPKIGDSYISGNDADVIATCISVECEQNPGNVNLWQLVATFDSDRLLVGASNNALLMQPEIEWGAQTYQRVMGRDVLGVVAASSSGERFDPSVEYDDNQPIVTITRNEANNPAALAITYQDALNSDVFGPGLPLQARIDSITSARQYDFGSVYWKTRYVIRFRRETHAFFILDQGFRGYADDVAYTNKVLSLLMDPFAMAPLSNPTLLNGRGRLISTVNNANVTLNANVTINDQTIKISCTDTSKLPPLADGNGVTPPDWYFEVMIDKEIMQVINVASLGGGLFTWTVIRGYANTIPAAHTNTTATVALQPYFRRFQPYKVLPFAALNLPVIT